VAIGISLVDFGLLSRIVLQLKIAATLSRSYSPCGSTILVGGLRSLIASISIKRILKVITTTITVVVVVVVVVAA